MIKGLNSKKKWLGTCIIGMTAVALFASGCGKQNDAQKKGGNEPVSILSEGAVNVYYSSTEHAQSGDWWQQELSLSKKLEEQPKLDITSKDNSLITEIEVMPDKTCQTFLGIGTSLEESTINNLAQLDEQTRKEFLRSLLDPVNGAGMSIFRLTIGTADFTGQDFYTYYDEMTTGEPDWENQTGAGFSIQKDVDYQIVKTVQELLEIADELGVKNEVTIFSSSWTPPGWMKEETESSKSYANNELLLKGGRLKDECIDDLAMYYTRYVEEYAKLGIPIYAITLQNEPLLEIDYPSCYMTGEQEGKLAIAIKKAMSESAILAEQGIMPKLWAFDHNCSDANNYVDKIFSVDGAYDAVDGIAFHDYSGDLSTMKNMLNNRLEAGETGKTVALTERSVWGTEGADRMIQYYRNGCVSYNAWVTMLDSNIAPEQWVGTPSVTMFVHKAGTTDTYWACPEFYITGQFGRFIRPGDIRVESDYGSKNTVTNVCFISSDKTKLIAVVANQTAQDQTFKFVTEDYQIQDTIPAKCVGSYIWEIPQISK